MTHLLTIAKDNPRRRHWRVAPAPFHLLVWRDRWRDRLRQRAALARLDDRLLADVGITRSDAEAEGRRWD